MQQPALSDQPAAPLQPHRATGVEVGQLTHIAGHPVSEGNIKLILRKSSLEVTIRLEEVGIVLPELLPNDITAQLQALGPGLGLPVLHGQLHFRLDDRRSFPKIKGFAFYKNTGSTNMEKNKQCFGSGSKSLKKGQKS